MAAPQWRVVLPRPPGTGDEGVPVARVLLSTEDLHIAQELATRLRREGAPAVLVEGTSETFCGTHPAEPAGGRCSSCGTRICLACVVEAGGKPACRPCMVARRARERRTRLRQLFSVFLFVVFLHQVVDHLRSEAAALDPSRPIRVALFQLVDPALANATVVRALNDPTSPYALHTIAAWYDKEHKRYTGRSASYVDVTVRGPWGARATPPSLGGPDDPWWRLAWAAWRYPRYFHGLAGDFGEDPGAYGARVYVVYADDAEDLASHSLGSKKGRVAVAFVSTEERNPAYALVTVAHELAHVLGADDTYQDGNFLARYPEGFVQPDAEPTYPQRFAELMAVDIPLAPGVEGEVRTLDQVRVGYRSAARMGWITEQQADLFYLPRPPDPTAKATPRPKAWPPAEEPSPTGAPDAGPVDVPMDGGEEPGAPVNGDASVVGAGEVGAVPL